jgi:hypothetical protein
VGVKTIIGKGLIYRTLRPVFQQFSSSLSFRSYPEFGSIRALNNSSFKECIITPADKNNKALKKA